jgi:hypothetical protein
LIGDDGEAEFLGIKIKGALLIRDRNANEFDLLDHGAIKVISNAAPRLEDNYLRLHKSVSFKNYSY